MQYVDNQVISQKCSLSYLIGQLLHFGHLTTKDETSEMIVQNLFVHFLAFRDFCRTKQAHFCAKSFSKPSKFPIKYRTETKKTSLKSSYYQSLGRLYSFILCGERCGSPDPKRYSLSLYLINNLEDIFVFVTISFHRIYIKNVQVTF